MKYIIILLAILLFLPLVNADSTFYDNPNDACVYPNPSVTSSVISQQESSGSTGGGCLTNWSCSSWSGCINDIQTRNCTKIKNYCYAGTKPNETQTCTVLPTPTTEEKIKGEAGTEKPKEPEKERNLFILLPVGIIIIAGFIILLLLKRKKRQLKKF